MGHCPEKIEMQFGHIECNRCRLILIISALPVKTFAGYQFVAQHCNEKDYVLFVDDDAFVKLNELKVFMKKIQSDVGMNGFRSGQILQPK